MTTDVSGTSIAIVNGTVVAIQGQPVSSTPPTTNQFLQWNGTQYVPTTPPSSLPPNGSSGGDLSSSYPNPTVAAITGSSVIETNANKLSVLKGQNVNVSSLKTANYAVQVSDFVVGIGTLTNSITITLPSSPASGDLYIVKDVNGTVYQFVRNDAGTLTTAGQTVTITPASGDIDGQSNWILSQPYESITIIYTGAGWSII
jgi:trimeric autotransporter adhesin